MNRLSFRKQSDSLALFSGGQRLFAGSSYEVALSAPEFELDRESEASLVLASDGFVAACDLFPDPLRRDVRTGAPLTLPDRTDGVQCELRVVLGSDTILLVGAKVTGHAAGEDPSGSAGPRWTVVDLGTVSSGTLAVEDMTQVLVAATPVPGPVSPLSIVVPSGGSLDAYVVVTSAGGESRFPFTDVLVGGSSPTWIHKDSLAMPASRWIIHIIKVAGDYWVDLRAGRPSGVELDPDGAEVVSAGAGG